jgi:hypothetical protein
LVWTHFSLTNRILLTADVKASISASVDAFFYLLDRAFTLVFDPAFVART